MDDPVSNTSNNVGKGTFSCIPRHVQLRIYLVILKRIVSQRRDSKGGRIYAIHQQTSSNET